MNTFLRTSLATLAVSGNLLGASAWAQDVGANVCDGVKQDKAACIREQGAARDAAKRGMLPTADASTMRRDALARCEQQPESDRQACKQRVMDTGDTTVQGSVMGGGILRTTVTPIPANGQQQ